MSLDSLTNRELEIVRLIADGLSNREIGQKLSLALETVKWYNKQIFNKLDVRSRTQAVARANELGLLTNMAAPLPHAIPAPPPADTPHNLPAQVTSFVGRRRELAETKTLLGNVRLVTLTGSGGSGKTRLALQLAQDVLPYFKDGVYFVPLAALSRPEDIFWAIAESVGYHFHQQREPLDQLLQYFHDKMLLLVLDNFEHLLEGAGLLADILKGAPHVKILVTSRERLNLYGEMTYTIRGMSVSAGKPQADSLRTDSVELFVQRAQAIHPTLDLTTDDLRHVEHICHLVEGMPLGIELAATWCDTLLLEDIAGEIEHGLDILQTELRDVPVTQRSVRATFDRSWNLLDDAQRTAFSRLSVFGGGFTRQAAQAVAGVDLRTLQTLLSKSLLRHNPVSGRYQIHDLLRQYARERLDDLGEAEMIYEAYAAYFADFMAEHWTQVTAGDQHTALHEIEADLENARAAWRYWLAQQNAARLQQFLHSFWVIYDIRSWYPTGIELFEQGVQVMQELGSDEARATLGWLLAAQGLYRTAGGIYLVTGGSRKGYELAKESVAILEDLDGYEHLMIIAYISLITTALHVNKRELARQVAQRLLEVATQIHDEWGIAKAMQYLTILAINDSDYDMAQTTAKEALATFDRYGDFWSLSVLCIEVLGLLAIMQNDLEAANDWIMRGLEAAQEIDYTYSQQTAYWQMGYVASLQENFVEAAKYWHKALEIGDDVFGSPIAIGFGGDDTTWAGRKIIDESS